MKKIFSVIFSPIVRKIDSMSDYDMRLVYNSIVGFFILTSMVAIYLGYIAGVKYAKIPQNFYIRKTDDIFISRGGEPKKVLKIYPLDISSKDISVSEPEEKVGSLDLDSFEEEIIGTSKISYFKKDKDLKNFRDIITEDFSFKDVQDIPRIEAGNLNKTKEVKRIKKYRIIDFEELKGYR